jgi:hypothetical protein
MIVTARFIVVRSGTSECGFFSVGMVTEEQTSCCVSHRATAITSGISHYPHMGTIKYVKWGYLWLTFSE